MENKDKHLTIGIVLPYLTQRGCEKQTFYIIKSLLKNNFNVVLFNIQGWGTSDVLRETGIEIINVGRPPYKNKTKISKFHLFKLAYLVKKYHCDCLISRHGIAAQVCGFAARINRVPSIVVFSNCIRKPEFRRNRSFIKEKIKLLRFLYKRGFANYFVTVSIESGNNLIATFPAIKNRVFSIQNGIDVNDLYKKLTSSTKIEKTKRFRLCFAGSLELDRKGVDILIDALYDLIVKKDQTDIELMLVGSGRDEEEIKKRIEEKGLIEFIIYTGEQKNPFPFMASSDLFILPSRREGLPNVLLEAMALGICSIAFDCQTGPNEIITNNVNGVLLPVNDRIGLVDTIIKLKENPEFRRQLADNGKKTIETKFTHEKMINQYVYLIKKVIKIS